MKTKFKIALILLMLPVSVVFSGSTLAVNQEKTLNRSEYLCGKILEYATKITQRISDGDKKIAEKRLNRENEMIQNRVTRDSKLAEFRTTWDQNRKENYQKLTEKATTQSQKDAVLNFENEVEKAVTVRKTAVDKALSDFRNGVDKLLEDRESSINSSLDAYTRLLDEAGTNAQKQCEAGVGPQEIRTNLINGFKQAKEALKGDVESYGKIRSDVETLRKTRDEAVRKAVSDFKASLDKAKEELKTAFKN